MKQDVRITADYADLLGESPVWNESGGRLWWVDMRAPALRSLDPATGAIESFPAPALCPAVLPMEGKGLLVAIGLSFQRFDPKTGCFTHLFDVEPETSGNRLNDSKCDRAGRLWAGTMRDFGAAETGALYRDSGAGMIRALGPLTVPNALCFSPDNARVYFTDTRKGAILVADLDEAGAPGAFRIFAEADAAPGRPDGATVDAEGFIWNARYGGACVARFSPDGRLDRVIDIPATQVTACAFGGENLATLFVTTARQKLSEVELAAQPGAGALFAIEPGPRGLTEAPWRRHK